MNFFLPLLFLIIPAVSNAQIPSEMWKDFKKEIIDRNAVISTVVSSIADQEVSRGFKENITRSMDSLNKIAHQSINPTKQNVQRLGKQNHHLTSLIVELFEQLEKKPGDSNYGNVVRLKALYDSAEEKFRLSVKRYNLKAKECSRKDLILNL